MKPISVDDCVNRLRNLRNKVVQQPCVKKPMTKEGPTNYVLNRLMTFGGIDGRISGEISDKDCILLWDNAFCLENPSMLQMIKQKRAAESWNEARKLFESDLGDGIVFI